MVEGDDGRAFVKVGSRDGNPLCAGAMGRAHLPRYASVQTVNRARYEFPLPGGSTQRDISAGSGAGSGCSAAISSRDRNMDVRVLRWHDRLRLETKSDHRLSEQSKALNIALRGFSGIHKI